MISKGFRLFLSLCLILSIITASVPLVSRASASTEYVIELSDAAYIRNRASDRDSALGGATLVVDSTQSVRTSFVKFDFADYMQVLDDITEIKFSLVPVIANASLSLPNNFTLTIMSDGYEEFSSQTLTWNSAVSAGMTADGSGTLIFTSETLTTQVRNESADISAAIKSHLSENPSNTIVTFRLSTTIDAPYTIKGVGSGYAPQLEVKQNINAAQAVQDTFDDLTFDRISECPSDGVVSDFELITSGQYGTRITWSSSDNATVDPYTGAVTRPKWGSGDKNMVLTALIENGGANLTKRFEFVVTESHVYPDEMLLEEMCYAVDSTFVRSGNSNKDTVVNNGNIVVDSDTTEGVYRYGFMKFDFTGYEDYLDKANSMQIRLETTSNFSAEGNNFVVYMLTDEYEDIDTSTLTYTIATEKGLGNYTDNMIYQQDGVKSATAYRSKDVLGAVKAHLENSDNKVVWFKVASTVGIGYTIYGASAVDALKPALVIKYPKPACDLDLITLKLPQTVDDDIILPSVGSFGSSITWTSSDESVISSSGEVSVGQADENYDKEDTVVTLSAKAVYGDDFYEKDYTVRVRRQGVIDATEDVTVSSDSMDIDSQSLSFGGTVGTIPVIAFDVNGRTSELHNSRKVVLKLYGKEAYSGSVVKLYAVTDDGLRGTHLDSVTYSDACEMLNSTYVVKSDFGDKAYVCFDVTEYIHSLSGGNAMFALSTDGVRMSLESLEGEMCKEPKLVVSPVAYTDEYAANLAKDSLLITDITNDNADLIRKNLTLPSTGRFNAGITWSAVPSGIVDPLTGNVTRPVQDTKVILTAHINVGDVTVDKPFELNVVKQETDYEYASYLVSTLTPEYDILTSSFVLRGEHMPDGATVSWVSSEPYEARVDGFNLVLNRPSSTDLPVTLTATLNYESETVSRTFAVTVVRSANKNILRNRKITSGDADASKAIDEDISTVWDISNTSVTIDMGTSRLVSGMTIVPERASFSGMTVSMSEDMYQWEQAFSGGTFDAGKLNYININPVAYGRYIRLDFPSVAEAVSFIGAYSFVDESNEDIFASIIIPSETQTGFSLVQNLYGNQVTWTSSSDIIDVSGTVAVVSPDSSGKNVTLTAQVSIDGTTVTKSYVVYVPGNGVSTGGGTGGGSGSFGGAAVVPPSQGVSTKRVFADLHTVPWAVDYINYLADKGIVSGKSSDSFAPDDCLKREEMAKIIAIAFNLSPSSSGGVFADVSADSWYGSYVYTLYESGIANGIGNGNFGAGHDITRQDAFTMIAKVLKADINSDLNSGFGDDAAIADYARGSINALKRAGIINGDEYGNINPVAKISRAEIAKVICLAISNK